MNNKTILSCANCFSSVVYNGLVKNVECCPKCKCDNESLVRVRYWLNGQPDYSINLLKTK